MGSHKTGIILLLFMVYDESSKRIAQMDLIEYFCSLNEGDGFGEFVYDGPNGEGKCAINGGAYEKENGRMVIEGAYSGTGPGDSIGWCKIRLVLRTDGSNEVLEYECKSDPDGQFD